MGVDYSFQQGYGFQLPENFEDFLPKEYEDDGFWEWFEDRLFSTYDGTEAKFPKLTYISCGALSYGNDGAIGVVTKRTSKVFYLETNFRDFSSPDTHSYDSEELFQLYEAADLFGVPREFKWLAGINVS